ncbi:hypothetical protein TNIN_428281 [Trichonephila inaurata madagascariensis]|uniref:Uncharacterized protein n=1 Tax=Trichonephila inaurata madagascariensis TaxID=2747483 RepID=A0A8X6YMT5_9ARAC|nr:hypothetical protein TNIN_428281 [Trichonephila inaurata madagascariensis]
MGPQSCSRLSLICIDRNGVEELLKLIRSKRNLQHCLESRSKMARPLACKGHKSEGAVMLLLNVLSSVKLWESLVPRVRTGF